MRHWRTTVNRNVAIKTGSTYISHSMIDITAISMANLRIWGFRLHPVRRNWPRVIATTTDNWKLQYGRFARHSRNFWQSVVVAMIWQILCWARPHRKSRIWRGNFDARHVIISVFWGSYRHFRLSVTVVLTYQHYFTPVHGLSYTHSSGGLDGHIAVSGCLSMSHLFVDTFFEFGVVKNFVYRARITVILILQIYSAVWVCHYDYVL